MDNNINTNEPSAVKSDLFSDDQIALNKVPLNKVPLNKVAVNQAAVNKRDNERIITPSNPYQSPTSSLQDSWQGDALNTNNSKWYQLTGRIGRLRYLSYQFLVAVVFYAVLTVSIIILALLMEAISGTGSASSDSASIVITLLAMVMALPFVFYAAIIYPKRRLHDLNQTGWWVVLNFIPLLNIILALYLIFAPAKQIVNEYGNPPRPNRTIHYITAIVVPIFAVFIIGILAAIAIPAYQDYILRAEQATLAQ